MAFQTAWRILGHVQDTEDAVQDALLEGWRAHCRGEIRNWGGLLRQAATSRALDRLRRRRSATAIAESQPGPESQQPDRQAECAELATWLRSIVSRLPVRQAEVFSMRYFAEMTNPEIAAQLGITPEAVAVALHKARKEINQRDPFRNDSADITPLGEQAHE